MTASHSTVPGWKTTLDSSIRFASRDFAASPDWLQSFAPTVHRSDRTWSFHRLDTRCEGRAQGRLAEPAGTDSGLVHVDDNQSVAAWVAVWPSAESSSSLYLVECLERDVLDVLLAPTEGRGETRM